MELLGHSQMHTTMEIYSHVMTALAREAADRMGALPLPGKGRLTATGTAITQIVEAIRTKKALLVRVELRDSNP
jgi:hypothetical protein